MAGIVRKGSINKNSKTDIRKQARKSDRQRKSPTAGHRLPQSIRARLYNHNAGDAPSQVHRCWCYIYKSSCSNSMEPVAYLFIYLLII